jgi:uncharacterized protein YifE (UPF0438 family)
VGNGFEAFILAKRKFKKMAVPLPFLRLSDYQMAESQMLKNKINDLSKIKTRVFFNSLDSSKAP